MSRILDSLKVTIAAPSFNEPGTTRIANTQDAAHYDNVLIGDLIIGTTSSGNDTDIVLTNHFTSADGGKRIHILPNISDDNLLQIRGNDLDFTSNRITIQNLGGTVDIDGLFAIYDLRGFRLTGTGHAGDTLGLRSKGFYATDFLTTGEGCSDFEIDHVASYNGTGSGITAKNDNGIIDMDNVIIRDNVIWNSANEGLYIGNTSGSNTSLLHNLQIYNNTLGATGMDGIQVSSRWVSGRVHNNTVTAASVGWMNAIRDNVHDFGFSLGTNLDENPDIMVDHNVLIGFVKAGQMTASGSGAAFGNVSVVNNLWIAGKSSWTWYTGGASLGNVIINYDGNITGNHTYRYDEVSNSSQDLNDALRSHMFRVELAGDIKFTDNQYDNSLVYDRFASGWGGFYSGSPPYAANGLDFELSGNTQGAVTTPILEDAYNAEIDLLQLATWTGSINANGGGSNVNTGDPVVYSNGDHVIFNGQIFKATGSPAAGESPATDAAKWTLVQFGGSDIPPLNAKVTNAQYAGYGYGFNTAKPDHFVLPNQAPVLAKSGGDTNIQEGDSYTPPTVTASDLEDGNITVDIVKAGDVVNPNTAGIYTETYNVVDSEGLAATELTHTVNVTVVGGSSLVKETYEVGVLGTYHALVYRPPGYVDGDAVPLWFFHPGAGQRGTGAGGLDKIGVDASNNTLMYDIRNGYEPNAVVIAIQIRPQDAAVPGYLHQYYFKEFLPIHSGATKVGLTGFSLGGGGAWSSVQLDVDDGVYNQLPSQVITHLAPVAGHQSYNSGSDTKFAGKDVWAFY